MFTPQGRSQNMSVPCLLVETYRVKR
uniref:Uncharacterized protein n=1 Tax=Arundo donax TaxID=35708 RepID=A0A0A9HKE3_ARUDO